MTIDDLGDEIKMDPRALEGAMKQGHHLSHETAAKIEDRLRPLVLRGKINLPNSTVVIHGYEGDDNVPGITAAETFYLLVANRLGPIGLSRLNLGFMSNNDGAGRLIHENFFDKVMKIIKLASGM